MAKRDRGMSLPIAYVGALPAPSIEISHFSSASCSYPVVDSDPNREEESFFSHPSPDQVPIPPSSLNLAKNDHGDIDMTSGYPDAVDEFELFCRIANSPARSSPPHSPRGAYGVSPMSCSPPGDFNEAQSCSGSPFRIAPPYARQRSRSVKEKSRNRLLLADDATARSRFSSKSMRERRQSRLSAHGAHGSAGGSTAAGEEQQLYRVRSFKRTAKGVVNQGDTFRTRSQCSLNSQNSSQVLSGGSSGEEAHRDPSITRLSNAGSQIDMDAVSSERTGAFAAAQCSPVAVPTPLISYRVQVLGAPGVGKSTLCRQFMSSEVLEVYNDLEDNETEEKYVTVLVDGAESNLTFLDTVREGDEKDPSNPQLLTGVQAYMVVYAIDNRYSFKFAAKILKGLPEDVKRKSAFFLVANKCDLVRIRSVSSEEGKHLAALYHCYFLEVSTALGHKVDDLLVGIVTEIQNQLKRNQKEKAKEERRRSCASKKSYRLKSASRGSSIANFFRRHFAKSCETLAQ